jgi:hypothetical protein
MLGFHPVAGAPVSDPGLRTIYTNITYAATASVIKRSTVFKPLTTALSSIVSNIRLPRKIISQAVISIITLRARISAKTLLIASGTVISIRRHLAKAINSVIVNNIASRVNLLSKSLSITANKTLVLGRLSGKIITTASSSISTIKRDARKIITAGCLIRFPLDGYVRTIIRRMTIVSTTTTTIVGRLGRIILLAVNNGVSLVKSISKIFSIAVSKVVTVSRAITLTKNIVVSKIVTKTSSFAKSAFNITVNKTVIMSDIPNKIILVIANNTFTIRRFINRNITRSVTTTVTRIASLGKGFITTTSTVVTSLTKQYVKEPLVVMVYNTLTISKRVLRILSITSTISVVRLIAYVRVITKTIANTTSYTLQRSRFLVIVSTINLSFTRFINKIVIVPVSVYSNIIKAISLLKTITSATVKTLNKTTVKLSLILLSINNSASLGIRQGRVLAVLLYSYTIVNKNITKAMSLAVSTVLSGIKTVLKPMSIVSNYIVTRGTMVIKPLAYVVNTVPTLTKSIRLSLTYIVATLLNFSILSKKLLAVTNTVLITARRTINRNLILVSNTIISVTKRTNKLLSVIVSSTETFTIIVRKILVVIPIYSVDIIKSISKRFNITVSTAKILAHIPNKNLFTSLTTAASISKKFYLIKTAIVNTITSFNINISKIILVPVVVIINKINTTFKTIFVYSNIYTSSVKTTGKNLFQVVFANAQSVKIVSRFVIEIVVTNITIVEYKIRNLYEWTIKKAKVLYQLVKR